MQLDLEVEDRRRAVDLAYRLYIVHLRAGADEAELEKRKTEFIRRRYAYEQVAQELWKEGSATIVS
jgi:hypothetical protein